jgi:hypothetical protein
MTENIPSFISDQLVEYIRSVDFGPLPPKVPTNWKDLFLEYRMATEVSILHLIGLDQMERYPPFQAPFSQAVKSIFGEGTTCEYHVNGTLLASEDSRYVARKNIVDKGRNFLSIPHRSPSNIFQFFRIPDYLIGQQPAELLKEQSALANKTEEYLVRIYVNLQMRSSNKKLSLNLLRLIAEWNDTEDLANFIDDDRFVVNEMVLYEMLECHNAECIEMILEKYEGDFPKDLLGNLLRTYKADPTTKECVWRVLDDPRIWIYFEDVTRPDDIEIISQSIKDNSFRRRLPAKLLSDYVEDIKQRI